MWSRVSAVPVGVLTGLEWAIEHAPWVTDIVSVPADGPFLPLDLTARLLEARAAAGAELAQAASGGRPNPVVGLWPVALAAELRHAITLEGVAKVDLWARRHRLAMAAFDDQPVDPLFNVNTPEDLVAAERLLDLEAGRRRARD